MTTINSGNIPTGATSTILQGQGIGTALVFSTSTWPATTTINQLLYSSAANTVAGLATANNGTLVTSSTGVPSILAGPGTTGNILQSNAAAAPSFSTATYPSTTTVSQILYSSSANVVAGLPTANKAVLTTSATGVPALTAIATDGQIIIGSTAGAPAAATLTAGTGISVTNAGNSITIATAGSGGLKSFQIFTSGTAATYTRPAGITSILVESVGGGGGGGGVAITTGGGAAGGGGGAGGYSRLYVAAAASTYTYTVGASGAGGTAGNNNGSSGTASTFVGTGANISAGGGTGGTGAANSTIPAITGPIGAGGTSSGGNVNLSGGSGGYGVVNGSAGAGVAMAGTGGGSFFCGNTPASPSTGTGANGNANTGCGGSGAGIYANGSAFAGGNGAAGLIIVWEYN